MKKLFYNGTILTMEKAGCEAVLIEDGRIAALGAPDELKASAGEDCEWVDLQGRCLMPAFIDGHSHLMQFANSLKLVPLSGCKSIAEVQENFRAYMAEKKVGPDDWVLGFGYDQNQLAEKRHLVREDLEAISTTNPIIVCHASYHMGTMNGKAMEYYGVHEGIEDPVGGAYGRDEQGRLTGYAEEAAYMSGPYNKIMSLDNADDYLEAAQDVYIRNGITTVQEGIITEPGIQMFQQAGQKGQLKVDVVAYVDLAKSADSIPKHPELKQYDHRLRLGGYKLFLDGSPQGKTAWMSKPYEDSGDYCGYPTLSDDKLDAYVQKALDDGQQLLAHCNGDAAAQQFINGYLHSRQKRTDTRPVMLHCQTLRDDQMPAMVDIGMLASFFVAHVYYWGDIHLKNFGPERGNNISPTGSALKAGLQFTLHQDTPVIPPNMLETVWAAVNRVSKAGVHIGPHQAISVYEALEDVTIHAA